MWAETHIDELRRKISDHKIPTLEKHNIVSVEKTPERENRINPVERMQDIKRVKRNETKTIYKCVTAEKIVFQDFECGNADSKQSLIPYTPSRKEYIEAYSDNWGNYHTTLTVNGITVTGTIDTGASIMLIPTGIAKSMGIKIDETKTARTQTANGLITVFDTNVALIKIGNMNFENVEIYITPNSPTLIGMNVLRHFKMTGEHGKMTLERH